MTNYRSATNAILTIGGVVGTNLSRKLHIDELGRATFTFTNGQGQPETTHFDAGDIAEKLFDASDDVKDFVRVAKPYLPNGYDNCYMSPRDVMYISEEALIPFVDAYIEAYSRFCNVSQFVRYIMNSKYYHKVRMILTHLVKKCSFSKDFIWNYAIEINNPEIIEIAREIKTI